jgi:hypothetical protein
MEQRLRDVLGFQIGDGTAQIMKTIVARSRAGRAAVGVSLLVGQADHGTEQHQGGADSGNGGDQAAGGGLQLVHGRLRGAGCVVDG